MDNEDRNNIALNAAMEWLKEHVANFTALTWAIEGVTHITYVEFKQLLTVKLLESLPMTMKRAVFDAEIAALRAEDYKRKDMLIESLEQRYNGGGAALGYIRRVIQTRDFNGDRVIWGSDTPLNIRFSDISLFTDIHAMVVKVVHDVTDDVRWTRSQLDKLFAQASN